MNAEDIVSELLEDQSGRDAYTKARNWWKTASPEDRLHAVRIKDLVGLEFDNLPWTYRTEVKAYVAGEA
jgi:hypothetical protein